MSIMDRATERKGRIVANRAAGFAEAEEWDLLYWQSRSAQERLAALVAIRDDVALVEEGKKAARPGRRQ
jgi:hypothetical protein